MRQPPSTIWLAVLPPGTARHPASGTPLAAHSNTVSLHQGGQHLLALIGAQTQKGVAHVAQNALRRQPGNEIFT
jgi:hypothetical protein